MGRIAAACGRGRGMLTDFTLVISSAPGRGLHRAAELARTHGGKIGIAVQTLARAMKLRRRYRDLEILPLWQLPGRIYWDIAILEDGHKMSGWASRQFFRRLKDTTARLCTLMAVGAPSAHLLKPLHIFVFTALNARGLSCLCGPGHKLIADPHGLLPKLKLPVGHDTKAAWTRLNHPCLPLIDGSWEPYLFRYCH